MRILGELKTEKTISRGQETTQLLKIMGLKKKKEESKDSAQLKLNSAACTFLGVTKGDRVEILEGDNVGEFFIAKVSGEDGRALSAVANSSTLTFTHGAAHNIMKVIATQYELTKDLFPVNDENKDALKGYTWHKLAPKAVDESADDAEVEVTEVKATETKPVDNF
jgi:hypothetical protein